MAAAMFALNRSRRTEFPMPGNHNSFSNSFFRPKSVVDFCLLKRLWLGFLIEALTIADAESRAIEIVREGAGLADILLNPNDDPYERDPRDEAVRLRGG
jgi:hypothetical protein